MLCELFTSFQCLLAALSPRYKMLVILYLKHVYYVSHLDIVSYPLVVLCGMIVTLLDSSVSIFVVGVPMFVFATWVN